MNTAPTDFKRGLIEFRKGNAAFEQDALRRASEHFYLAYGWFLTASEGLEPEYAEEARRRAEGARRNSEMCIRQERRNREDAMNAYRAAMV